MSSRKRKCGRGTQMQQSAYRMYPRTALWICDDVRSILRRTHFDEIFAAALLSAHSPLQTQKLGKAPFASTYVNRWGHANAHDAETTRAITDRLRVIYSGEAQFFEQTSHQATTHKKTKLPTLKPNSPASSCRMTGLSSRNSSRT